MWIDSECCISVIRHSSFRLMDLLIPAACAACGRARRARAVGGLVVHRAAEYYRRILVAASIRTLSS